MTQIELEPYEFWSMIALGLITFVIFPIFYVAVTQQEQRLKWREKLGLQDWPWLLFAAGVTVWIMIFVALVFGLLLQLSELIWLLVPESPTEQAKAPFALVRLTAMTATLGAVVALPFTLIRLRLTQEANDTATDSLFNDKLNTATQDLYAMRQRWDGEQHIWEDDITRRNAAIDRLESLAEERPNIAPRISRLLSVYVRELSREHPPETPPKDATSEELETWVNILSVKRPDIEISVQALGRLRRIPDVDLASITIDLRGANLQRCTLGSLSFQNANFSYAHLQGAIFVASDISCADFSYAQMQFAQLSGSKFSEIDIQSAKMSGTTLPRICYDLEFLWSAQQQGATLTEEQYDLAAQYAGHLDRLEDEAKAAWQNSID